MVVVGDSAVICGLRNAQQYNGTVVTIVRNEGDRFVAEMSDGSQLKLRAENLDVIQSQSQGSQRQQVARRESGSSDSNPMSDLGMIMLSGAFNVAKRNWHISLTWIVGILLATFATGFAVSEDEAIRYESLLQSVNIDRLSLAEDAEQRAYAKYSAAKGWLSCDERCTHWKQIYQAAEAERKKAQEEVDAQISGAKQTVGLFSTYGVTETRQLFWKRFNQGKQFAKNQSFWDLMFAGLFNMGRDESLVSFLLRFLINVLMNFTLGLIGAGVAFMWTLWSVISSFQPGYIQGLVFFVLAAVAAFSFMATWLLGLYSAAAGGVYVIGKATGGLRIEGHQQRRQFVR